MVVAYIVWGGAESFYVELERIANKYWPLTRARHYPEKLRQYL